ncbi:hypothetical protein [Nostoc linckia]|nr:hypothetical protein [Nostoc linckia]
MGRWGDGGDRGDGEMGRLVLSGAEVWGDGEMGETRETRETRREV